MLSRPLLSRVLHNDALTRGLNDPEARILVEWLVEHVEAVARSESSVASATSAVERLCRRGRAISRFVGLWSVRGLRGAAVQLAGAERFTWPLPTGSMDPCELMHGILAWEDAQLEVEQKMAV